MKPHLVALAVALVLAACAAPRTAPIGSTSSEPTPATAVAAESLLPLTGWTVSLDVAGPVEGSSIWRYAGGTGLERSVVADGTRTTLTVGPVSSEFEAGWIARLEPGAEATPVGAWQSLARLEALPERVRWRAENAGREQGLSVEPFTLDEVAHLDVEGRGTLWRLRVTDQAAVPARVLVWAPERGGDAGVALVDARSWPFDGYLSPHGTVMLFAPDGRTEVIDLVAGGRGTGYFQERWQRRPVKPGAALAIEERTAFESVSQFDRTDVAVEVNGARPFVDETGALRWTRFSATFRTHPGGGLTLRSAHSEIE